MASSGDKGFKQDLVVSIRYRNDLPPPPMPPKFLDIDTGGIAQYLTTSYASSLARREESNIEVDAEGGMPIDMIGVPGYFLGDESAIMAPEIQPILDPADQALLLSIDQLKSHGAKNNVSFLRRTQYMTSQNARTNNDPFMTTTPRSKKVTDKPAAQTLARDDKENVKRHVQKGFDVAYPDSIPYNPPEAKGLPSTPAERDAWRNPTHPDNPRLKPVAYYPVLPDLNATTDQAMWYRIKYDKPPLPANRNKRDDRTDTALLVISTNEVARPLWQAKKDAFDKNPQVYEDPGPEPFTWSMCVPKHPESVPRIRKFLNDADPDKDDPKLIQDLLEESVSGDMRVPFERARVYPTVLQAQVEPARFMAMSLFDPETAHPKSRLRKQGCAAYYYPILETVRLKADRTNVGKPPTSAAAIAAARAANEQDELTAGLVDQVMILARDPSAQEIAARAAYRGDNDKAFAERYAELRRDADAEMETVKADEIIQEQGTVHQGMGDVSMAEAEDGEKADVTITNGTSRKERDGDDDDDEEDGDRRQQTGMKDQDDDMEDY